jgi:ubiquinone/menaquinone biosynthesis C-methylase UbiE
MRRNNYLIGMLILILSQSLFGQHVHDHDKESKGYQDERVQWQLPSRVIREIGIDEGMVVADVGAGEGYFSILIAKFVGPGGKVYASDIDNSALQKLEEKYQSLHVKNIVTILGKPTDPLLPENEADIILIVNTIHFIDDFKIFMENTINGLKTDGKVVIVQWDAYKMSQERPYIFEEIFSTSTVLRKIYNSGLEVERILTFLPMQNIYICTPNKYKEDLLDE